MPLPVESLTNESPIDAIREAISATISKLIKEGKSQKEAAGEAYGIARDKTGKELKGG
jgi:hypothetical protein